ncbi:MAG: hypothetical protein GXW99_05795 [Clostridiales bacterium]|nr:hypothetical protein [Clostridiales bacterium]
MIEGRYKIILRSPLGPRFGVLRIEQESDSVSGVLELLNRTNIFTGGHATGDSFSCSGEMQTLMRHLSYVMEGSVSGDKLQAVVKTLCGATPVNMTISGTRL